ncbi:MAG: DUF2281 domain-containing protein [Nitrospirae bacterium]|nr:DUF2281 domain-containing protein [Nitrospirota bacterium]
MTLMEQIHKQIGQLPPESQREVLDFATFLQERVRSAPPVSVSVEAERGKRIKAAFLKLAELKVFADIKDPVEWQRQIRRDRPLPGREA